MGVHDNEPGCRGKADIGLSMNTVMIWVLHYTLFRVPAHMRRITLQILQVSVTGKWS